PAAFDHARWRAAIREHASCHTTASRPKFGRNGLQGSFGWPRQRQQRDDHRRVRLPRTGLDAASSPPPAARGVIAPVQLAPPVRRRVGRRLVRVAAVALERRLARRQVAAVSAAVTGAAVLLAARVQPAERPVAPRRTPVALLLRRRLRPLL